MFCINCGKELKSNEYLYCIECLNKWFNIEISDLKTLKCGLTSLITNLENMETWITKMIETKEIPLNSAYHSLALIITIQIANLIKFLTHLERLIN